MVKKAAILLITFVLFSSLSCKDFLEEKNYGDSNAPSKILISGTSNDYIDTVVKKIVDKYSESAYLEIISLKALRKANLDDYDVVLITDEIQAWMAFNGLVRKYANNPNYQDKLIVLLTKGDPDYEWQAKSDVDVITAATPDNDDVTPTVNELFTRIDNILK